MSRSKVDVTSVAAQARQDAIMDHIRSLILSGQLAPEERLVQDDLAARFGVSRTPIREALSRLAQEGLVNISSYKGASVATLSIEHLQDIYTIRVALESHATYLAALNSDDEFINMLQDRMDEMGAAFQSKDFEKLVATHNRFHLAVYSQAQCQHLYEMINRYLNLSNVYLRMSLIKGRGAKDPIKEHGDIIQILRYKEADAACSLMRTHLNMTRNELKAILEQQH